MNEVIGRRPTPEGGGRHGLLLSQGISELLNELGEAIVAGPWRWDPVGGPRKKGEPIGCGSAHDNAVDGVLELAKQGIGGGSRSIGEVAEIVVVVGRRQIGLGSVNEEDRGGRWLWRFGREVTS